MHTITFFSSRLNISGLILILYFIILFMVRCNFLLCHIVISLLTFLLSPIHLGNLVILPPNSSFFSSNPLWVWEGPWDYYPLRSKPPVDSLHCNCCTISLHYTNISRLSLYILGVINEKKNLSFNKNNSFPRKQKNVFYASQKKLEKYFFVEFLFLFVFKTKLFSL